MTEYESDPQRRPAPTDAEPSHPTAELPSVERAQSDSPTATAGDAAAASTGEAAPAPSPEAARDPRTPAPATTDSPGAAPSAPPYPVSGAAPSSGHPYGPPGYQQHRYPAGPWYGGQQPGWSGGQPGGYGQPGQAHQQHHPGGYGPPHHPHQPGQPHPGQPPHLAGQPLPPWAAPQGGQTGPRPGRAAKFVGAGVLVLGLMFGSGVAGGALALALDGDSGITRTYSAAPIIDSADLPRIAASVQPSVVSIATDNGEGSGVILSADGYVLTNNHVIASASGDVVRVIFADGETAQARIVGTDPKTDLAVVKASGVSDLKPATFGDSDAMQVGDQVLALGSPLGLQGSVTAGILSARDRTIQAGSSQQVPGQGVSSIAGLLQTDAPINPGNSGGALVNTRGEVIGINTAIATSGQGSTGNIGVGFAIPSNKAKDVAAKLQRGEKVSHPTLGVSVNRAEGGGALVAAVTPGSAADKAGLQRGDVITRFGDKVINDSDDLVGAVQAGKVGDRVEVTYKRNGAESKATVTLAEAS